MSTAEQALVKGYQAYSEVVGGLAHTGKPMPKWEDLPEKTRQAWAAFLAAAMKEITG